MTFAVHDEAVLDGTHLSTVPAKAWGIGLLERRHVRESATGVRREVLLATPAGEPLLRQLRTFSLSWDHVAAMRGTVEEILSVPGEHELVLWREEFVAWGGDGARNEFTLPNRWLLVEDGLAALPASVTAESVAPRVKVGVAGAVMVHSLQPVAAFDAGDPPAGEVWFAEGEPRMKLGEVPPAGSVIHARLVPVYRVLHSPERPEKRFERPVREPLEITLLETG